jgi:16S rRNA (cytidine1402-2'-O)-methyltransferase
MDAFPQTIKEVLDDIYIVENDKTARKIHQISMCQKKQADLTLYVLNKHTEIKEHLDFIKHFISHNIGP